MSLRSGSKQALKSPVGSYRFPLLAFWFQRGAKNTEHFFFFFFSCNLVPLTQLFIPLVAHAYAATTSW